MYIIILQFTSVIRRVVRVKDERVEKSGDGALYVLPTCTAATIGLIWE
jgi:hypothetical protein